MLNTIEIKDIKSIAYKAGEEILRIYEKDFEVEYKDDNSPLTEADKKSNEIICSSLQKMYPHIPILSEENKQVPYEERKTWGYYWCIDPIDGTKEFIKKNGEFTINIALVHKNTPVLGVVYAPVLDQMYSAKKGEGAFLGGCKLPLHVKEDYANSLNIVASKSHLSDETKAFVETLKAMTQSCELVSKGSSLKLCMVAEGEADVYPRLAPTMEWDTAAAHAIVLEAGKRVYIYDSKFNSVEYLRNNVALKPLVYNKENLLNPYFVVV